MWKESWGAVTAVLSYAPMAIALGIAIIVVSGINATKSKKGIERALSIIAAILSVLLLSVQYISGKLASQEAEITSQAALMQQRDTLTRAFNDGTMQVMTATSEAAARTQQSAMAQTEAIKQQAAQHYAQLQSVTMGARNCPEISFLDSSWPTQTQRPTGFVLTNPDKSANVYEFSARVFEYGPPAIGTTNSSILQQSTFNIPLIYAQHSETYPFQFLSKTNTISIQISASTRANEQCGYQLAMNDEGNKWVLTNDERSQDGKTTRTLNSKQAVADWYAKVKKAKGVR